MPDVFNRREEILEKLIERKRENVKNLAHEFGVSERTILRDIDYLSIKHNITTQNGGGGGIFYLGKPINNRKYLTEAQEDFLTELVPSLSEKDVKTAQSIIDDFSFKKEK